jgi:hypothetical protein
MGEATLRLNSEFSTSGTILPFVSTMTKPRPSTEGRVGPSRNVEGRLEAVNLIKTKAFNKGLPATYENMACFL